MTTYILSTVANAETNVAVSATRDVGTVLCLDFLLNCALFIVSIGFVVQLASKLWNAQKSRKRRAKDLARRPRADWALGFLGRCVALGCLLGVAVFFLASERSNSSPEFPAPSNSDAVASVAVENASNADSDSVALEDASNASDVEIREVVANNEETGVWRGEATENARSQSGVRSAAALERKSPVQTDARRPSGSAVSIQPSNDGDSAPNGGGLKRALPGDVVFIPHVGAEAVVEERPSSQVSSPETANRGKISQPVYREDPRNGAARSKIAQTCFEPLAPILPYPTDGKLGGASEPLESLTLDGQPADFAPVAVEPLQEKSILEEIDAEFNRISDRVKTSVLPIETRKKAQNASQKIEEETGTGFLTQYLDRVFLITNRHVVADAASRRSVRVFLPNQKVISPTKIMTCVDFDLAVLELDPAELPRDGSVSLCFFGDSDTLRVANLVGTVGSPFGLENTVTYGHVGALRRRRLPLNKTRKNSLQEFIQIDASINPGNSGGPLFNSRGEVVGVVTAIATTSGKNEGVAFAIPINLALEVVKATIDAGGWRRSHMGVELEPATRTDVAATNLPGVFGAKIVSVQPLSPAEKAGLRGGDVVLTFDGKVIEDDAHLARLIAIGDAERGATLQILRGSKVYKLQTALKQGEISE